MRGRAAVDSLRQHGHRRYNPAVWFCRKQPPEPAPHSLVIPPLKSKPIRTVLLWQVLATVIVAIAAGLWRGTNGAVSALLGGAVNVAAGIAYAGLLGVGAAGSHLRSAPATLVTMLRAEAAKLLVIVGGLWLALSTYKDIEAAAFFTAFVITVIVFSMAFFVRDGS
jgi:ATP synthase protein I